MDDPATTHEPAGADWTLRGVRIVRAGELDPDPPQTPGMDRAAAIDSGQEPVVVNLELPEVEPNPEQVHWVDDLHREP